MPYSSISAERQYGEQLSYKKDSCSRYRYRVTQDADMDSQDIDYRAGNHVLSPFAWCDGNVTPNLLCSGRNTSTQRFAIELSFPCYSRRSHVFSVRNKKTTITDIADNNISVAFDEGGSVQATMGRDNEPFHSPSGSSSLSRAECWRNNT